MDNFLELLVPLIIAAIYFFGNMLGKKGGSGADGEEGPDPEALRRQREIQEEIRRRIEERRSGAGAGEQRPGPAPAAQPQTVPAPAPPPVMPAPVEQPAPAVDTPTLAYRRRMEEQMAAIRETERRAAELRKRAGAARAAVPSAPEPAPADTLAALPDRPVIASLRNPRAARAAFVYAEVLGPPAASREPGGRVPALAER